MGVEILLINNLHTEHKQRNNGVDYQREGLEGHFALLLIGAEG